ncbi:hypothetical protein C8R46DRAFT_904775, partial [Mycena filopes]
ASYLEQGQRLENLSWRLWHLQNLMVDTDNAKSKREFKKLSKCMGDKLDKEKGRSIESLPAPAFTRTQSTDLLRARAAEKERTREAGVNAPEHTLQRMQFTFAVEPVVAPTSTPSNSSSNTTNAGAATANANATTATTGANATQATNATTTFSTNANAPGTATKRKRPAPSSSFTSPHSSSNPSSGHAASSGTVRLPTLFSTSFGPAALLYPSPSLAPRMNYGEADSHYSSHHSSSHNSGMRIARPTIELPLDELLKAAEDEEFGASSSSASFDDSCFDDSDHHSSNDNDNDNSNEEGEVEMPDANAQQQQAAAANMQRSRARNAAASGAGAGAAVGAAGAGARQGGATRRGGNPGATASGTGAAGAVMAAAAAANNTAPGGVKAECSNCGATHTPLWRRGLNDELNCNACGLYCKLHKRPRPKTMRSVGGGGEGRGGTSVRAEAVDVMAQCYNCHTTATPLWRKDDEGKTVCNACGLYYKLHGSARPISMKSDVIRKRSRHDARRGGASASVSETPTASPGVSRRASPAPGHRDRGDRDDASSSASAGRRSPTLAPDGTTTHSYADADARSELSSALGAALPKPGGGGYPHPYPYREAYPDALPFASVDVGSELESARVNKRRRMSVDSASEPPSSAVSYGSYADGYASASSSSQFSMDFPFSRYPNVGYNEPSGGAGGAGGGGAGNGNGNGATRGAAGGNAFWHPPMLLQGEGGSGSGGAANPSNSPGGFLHPPMLPTQEEAPMDYLHPPMVPQMRYSDEDFFGPFMQVHPPMLPGDEGHLMGGFGGAHPPMLPYEDIYDSNGNMRY